MLITAIKKSLELWGKDYKELSNRTHSFEGADSRSLNNYWAPFTCCAGAIVGAT